MAEVALVSPTGEWAVGEMTGDSGSTAYTSSLTIEVDAVPTAEVAKHLGKKPQSLSPARDALLKKGLIYSAERGQIAFTVPHFGRYLRDHT